MARSVTLGNGNLLVGLDERGQVRDFYYPFVGHANHVSGASGSFVHRVGVWVDNKLRWLSDPSWSVEVRYTESSGTSDIYAKNFELGVTLHMIDVVHNEKNVFIRKITITNEQGARRTIKLYFGQEFRITESRRGDTAFFDPRTNSIIHYKGHNAFLVYATIGGVPFADYTVGLFGIEGKSGSYTDAEDGVLSKNPIEHGSVDSVLELVFTTDGFGSTDAYYWIVAGRNVHDAHALHTYVLEETPDRLIESTDRYWHAWMEKDTRNFGPLSERIVSEYKRSLAVMRTHADNRGGIIASSDSDMLNQGRDAYAYVWPRDASYIANTLDRAGHIDVTQRFFSFMAQCMEPDGYLMHKYRVDGVLGSSWHPWVQRGVFRLPIQEDETATVVHMLAEHYAVAHDLEFIESLYNPFIEKCANFMYEYVEHETGLPSDSYDLWEEKFGSSTYTASSVYAGLMSAATLSALLGKREQATKYRERAMHIKDSILTYLYDVNEGIFIKSVRHEPGKLEYDRTLDLSSLFGIIFFGVLDVYDKRVQSMFAKVVERLTVPGPLGGFMRYEGDKYYKTSESASPNAWCITTLWVARYYIRLAKSKVELERALDILNWTCDRATPSGILPEQIHPYTGEHLSTAPLIWSHAEFVTTVDEYVKKVAMLK